MLKKLLVTSLLGLLLPTAASAQPQPFFDLQIDSEHWSELGNGDMQVVISGVWASVFPVSDSGQNVQGITRTHPSPFWTQADYPFSWWVDDVNEDGIYGSWQLTITAPANVPVRWIVYGYDQETEVSDTVGGEVYWEDV
jgi:hypothetical protein